MLCTWAYIVSQYYEYWSRKKCSPSDRNIVCCSYADQQSWYRRHYSSTSSNIANAYSRSISRRGVAAQQRSWPWRTPFHSTSSKLRKRNADHLRVCSTRYNLLPTMQPLRASRKILGETSRIIFSFSLAEFCKFL